MSHKITKSIFQTLLVLGLSVSPYYAFANDETIIAKRYNSNFPQSKGNYNGITAMNNGLVYYVLCSGDVDIGAQMYSFDPKDEQIKHLADLTEAVGEKGLKAIPQGKSHVNFYEYEGKLFFATHIDFYKNVDGKELMGDPPTGYKPYPGGHILSYDLKTGEFEDLGIASPKKGGIIALTMDTKRGRLYGITWPTGEVFRYDVKSKDTKIFGQFFADGEEGDGDRYQVLSRSLTVNPINGSVFFNTPPGDIYEYLYDKDDVVKVTADNLKKDYFGTLDARSMGYQWRQSVWSEYDQMVYGIHLESEYLFRINPKTRKVEIVDRLASETTKRAGATGYGGSLGLVFGPENRILYHISHAYPNKADFEKFGEKAVEELILKNHHLIAYDLQNQKTADLGEIVFEDGTEPIHINSLTLGKDGNFYALSTIELQDGSLTADLISFPMPK